MAKTTKKPSKALTTRPVAGKPLAKRILKPPRKTGKITLLQARKAVKLTRKQGGQTLYNPVIAAKILSKLAQGKSVLAISRDRGMPSETTIRRWGDGMLGIECEKETGAFVADYARAQNYGYEHCAEQILDVPTSMDKNTYHSKRLEVDTIKWYLSKMKPSKYGDRIEIAGDKASPLTIVLARYGELESS